MSSTGRAAIEGPAMTVASDPVPSPCVNVCVMDEANGLCIGCLRTLDEIATWGALDADAKRAILATIGERRTRLAANE